MNKTNQVIAIFLTLLLLSNCSSFVEGLGGTKKKGSDEFLVEKKLLWYCHLALRNCQNQRK